MEDINLEFDDIRANGTDRGQVRESKGSQINSCDAITGWAVSGVATPLAIDTTKFLEGTASLKLGATGVGVSTNELTIGSVDYSAKKYALLDLWHDFDLQSSITSVEFRIGSDSSNYKSIAISLTNPDFGNWKQRHKMLISAMSDTGTPVMTAVTYVAVVYTVTAAIGAGKILVDDIRISNLAVDIAPLTANVGGIIQDYAGITEQAITDAATNYIQISDAGTLLVNTTGFLTTHARIAEVVAAGGVITSIALKRQETVGGDFASSKVLDGNVTITYNADGTIATAVDVDQSVTYTFSYSSGRISSYTDGTSTWTPTYNSEGNITSIAKV